MVKHQIYGIEFTAFVQGCKAGGMRPAHIPKELRSKNWRAARATIFRHLEKPLGAPPRISPGRPTTVPRRVVSRVARGLTKGTYKNLRHAEECMAKETIHAPHSILQRKLSETPTKWKRVIKIPKLTKQDKRKRLEWAKSNLESKPNWRRVVFCDEKKWNVNGPNGCTYRWVNTEGPPPTATLDQKRSSRMIWGGFGASAGLRLLPTTAKVTCKKYCGLLEEAFNEGDALQSNTLLQDRAPCHTARDTKKWLRAHHIPVIYLPPRSCDLNPIEELWGTLTRRVFAHVGTFTSLDKLLTKVDKEWKDMMSDNTMRCNLADSMQQRCEAVVKLRGGFPV